MITAPSRQVRFTAAIAGQGAGVLMVICLMVGFAVVLHESWTFPLRLFAALVLGPPALDHADARTLLVGFLVHQLGPVVLWARLYGLLLGFRSTPPSLSLSLAVGLIVGLIALLLDVFLLLPPVLSQMHGANVWAENVPRGMAAIAHAVYGATLGSTYGWLARTETRPPADDRK